MWQGQVSPTEMTSMHPTKHPGNASVVERPQTSQNGIRNEGPNGGKRKEAEGMQAENAERKRGTILQRKRPRW